MAKKSAKAKRQKWKKKYAWVWQLFLMLLAVAVCGLVIYQSITNAKDKTDEVEDVPIFWEYDEQGRPFIDDYTYVTFYERADVASPVVERRYISQTDSTVSYSYTYVYDGQGRLIRRNRFDTNTVLTGFSEYLYNESGVNYRTNIYVDDEFTGYFLNTFDHAGRKTETAEYDINGTFIVRLVFTYEADGDPQSVTQYSADGTVLGTSDYNIPLD